MEANLAKLLALGVVFILALVPAACAGNHAGTEGLPGSAPLETTDWKLVEVYGKPVAPRSPDRQAHLVFSPEEGQLSGSGGCNRLMGSYRIDGEKIAFGPMGITHMACTEGMEVESLFLKALSETATWHISGRRLTFRAAGRPVAVFEAAASESPR